MATMFCLRTPKGSARTPLGPIYHMFYIEGGGQRLFFCAHGWKDGHTHRSTYRGDAHLNILGIEEVTEKSSGHLEALFGY